MTQTEFDNYRIQIYYISSQKAERLAKDHALGKSDLEDDEVNLALLNAYIDILNNYTLYEDNEEDRNVLSRDEMQDIVTHINKICNTHYNIDFVKET